MKTFKEYLMEQANKGTYAAVIPSKESEAAINSFIKTNNIPLPSDQDKLHSTLLYSRKHLPKYSPESKFEYSATPKAIEVWPTKSGARCLVLTLDCPDLVKRHKELMDQHKATYDFPDYKPHISLSYDIGNFDEKKLNIKDLPNKITLTGEYQEDLDTSGK